jgi:hypothetical protein
MPCVDKDEFPIPNAQFLNPKSQIPNPKSCHSYALFPTIYCFVADGHVLHRITHHTLAPFTAPPHFGACVPRVAPPPRCVRRLPRSMGVATLPLTACPSSMRPRPRSITFPVQLAGHIPSAIVPPSAGIPPSTQRHRHALTPVRLPSRSPAAPTSPSASKRATTSPPRSGRRLPPLTLLPHYLSALNVGRWKL